MRKIIKIFIAIIVLSGCSPIQSAVVPTVVVEAPTRMPPLTPTAVLTPTPSPAPIYALAATATARLLRDTSLYPPTFAGEFTEQPTAVAPIVRPSSAVVSRPPQKSWVSPSAVMTQNRAAPDGMQLAYAKIGFHTAPTGDARGLGDWMRALDATGIPVFLKSADSAGPLYEVQELMKISGVPHVLVYRHSGGHFELPDYNKDPVSAAQEHWARHVADWPPELDPSLIWMETVNEVDHERSEWWGNFAQETARLAIRDGRKWAAFGWSSGEPEFEDWKIPSMQGFLEIAGAHPEKIAVAIHEYSLDTNTLDYEYPFRLGRFQELFLACDEMGIPRPTVLITEWGWSLWDVPSTDEAMKQIEWASHLYAMYPEVKGVGIWYLGGGWQGIAGKVQKLIAPVTEFTLHNYFIVPDGKVIVDPYLFADDDEWKEESECRWCFQMRQR